MTNAKNSHTPKKFSRADLVTRLIERNRSEARLVSALKKLCDLYIANRSSVPGGDFISCITPPHASDMTTAQRKNNSVWAAWDAARAAIAKAEGA